MLQNKDIVCMAFTTWGGDYVKSTVKLMSHLAIDNRILFIEYPYTYKDLTLSILGKRKEDVKRLLGLKPRIQKVKAFTGTEVNILTVPPSFPYASFKSKSVYKFFLKLNALLIQPSIKRAMRKLNFKDPIFINAFNPFFGIYQFGKFNESRHFYYCYDAISQARFGDIGSMIETDFSKMVDGVITTSDKLKEGKVDINPNCHVVKNGVDFDHFYSYYKQHEKTPKKKIGYIGSVDWRFEAEMIAWVASQMPDYIFEFVGRNANPEAQKILEQQANIEFHGPVKPNEVPGIMFNCDVGIIPYSRHPENKSVYPLKINEYLAVGTPVVMTDFAHLPEFEGLVSVASTKEEFLAGIKEQIETNSVEKEVARTQFASKNSWAGRASELSKYIHSQIKA